MRWLLQIRNKELRCVLNLKVAEVSGPAWRIGRARRRDQLTRHIPQNTNMLGRSGNQPNAGQAMRSYPAWSQVLKAPFIVGGRFRCTALIAKGATAEVYFAEDLELLRPVAIKRLVDERFKAFFDNEQAILSELNHVAVPWCFDRLAEGGRSSLVLSYFECAALSEKGHSEEEVIERGLRLLEVVRYLHELPHPVIHTDIKPANILANDFGQLFLVDFAGAQRENQANPALAQGTIGYAPPEQLSGGKPRVAWDLYAVGAVLHQLLTGIHPSSWKPGSMPSHDCALELIKVLRRALESNPKDRFSSAREFHMALDRTRKLVASHLPCPGCKVHQAVGTYFCHRCGCSLRADELKSAKLRLAQSNVTRQGLTKLVSALQGESHATQSLCFLRNECEAMGRPLGFDVLMSIDHLPFEPLQHQLRVLKRVLKDHQGRSILADEVGLGKTVEAGLVREELKMRGLVNNTLVLVPPHLRTQWKEELFDKFRERFEVYNPQGGEDPRLSQVQNLIISLAAAAGRSDSQSIPEALRSRHWDLVIVDEAHHAKNRTTNRYRFLNSLSKSYMLLLTATPVQNNVEELFNLASLVRPGLLGGPARQFKETYGVNGRTVDNHDRLRLDLEKVMIRTKRSQAYVKFPERIPRIRRVLPSPMEASLYEEVTQFVREIGSQTKGNQLRLIQLQQRLTSSPDAICESLQGLVDSYPQARSLASKAAQLKGKSSKLNAVIEVIEQVKERVVIFTDHVATQLMLSKELGARSHRTSVFRGSTSEKEKALKTFAESGKILVVSASGNEGLNLQHYCSVCINFDLPWNPMRVEQRIGRLQRLGQPRDVMVFNLVTADTVEEQVLRVLEQKIRLFELSIGQLDLILGEDFGDENSFQEAIWKSLLQSRTKEEMERMLDKRFCHTSHRVDLLKAAEDEDETPDLDFF